MHLSDFFQKKESKLNCGLTLPKQIKTEKVKPNAVIEFFLVVHIIS